MKIRVLRFLIKLAFYDFGVAFRSWQLFQEFDFAESFFQGRGLFFDDALFRYGGVFKIEVATF